MSGGKRMPISVLSAEELQAAYAQYEKEAPRPTAGAPDQEPLNRLPPEMQRARYWAFERLVRDVGLLPKGSAAAESWRQEFTALRRQRLGDAHPLGDLPLIALERGNDIHPIFRVLSRCHYIGSWKKSANPARFDSRQRVVLTC